MCVVSMIAEHYESKWRDLISPVPLVGPIPVTRVEFDQLKREVQEMKELLTKALDYDKKTNQHQCADGGKLDNLEKVAAAGRGGCKGFV